jgi:hypothetical protein
VSGCTTTVSNAQAKTNHTENQRTPEVNGILMPCEELISSKGVTHQHYVKNSSAVQVVLISIM